MLRESWKAADPDVAARRRSVEVEPGHPAAVGLWVVLYIVAPIVFIVVGLRQQFGAMSSDADDIADALDDRLGLLVAQSIVGIARRRGVGPARPRRSPTATPASPAKPRRADRRPMSIFVVRHAKAGSRDSWDGDDLLRPLTKAGRRQAEAVADRLVAEDGHGRCGRARTCGAWRRWSRSAAGSACDVIAEPRLAEGAPFEPTLELLGRAPATAPCCAATATSSPSSIDALARRGHGAAHAAGLAQGGDLGPRRPRRRRGGRHGGGRAPAGGRASPALAERSLRRPAASGRVRAAVVGGASRLAANCSTRARTSAGGSRARHARPRCGPSRRRRRRWRR